MERTALSLRSFHEDFCWMFLVGSALLFAAAAAAGRAMASCRGAQPAPFRVLLVSRIPYLVYPV
jgi:hypothetical protein